MLIAAGTFGYVCFNFLQMEFKVIFCIFGILAIIAYIVESIRNKYEKIHIVMSVLSFFMFITLIAHYLIQDKYQQYSKCDNYIFGVTILVIVMMISVVCVNYFKTVTKKSDRISMIILISIIIALLIIGMIGIVLKELGVIS